MVSHKSNNNKIKILLLSVSLSKRGGVSNYTNLLLKNIDNKNINIEYFETGRKLGFYNPFLLLLIFLKQLINFKVLLERSKPDIIHLNMSIISPFFLLNYLFFKIAHSQKVPFLIFIRGWRPNFQSYFQRGIILPYIIKYWFNSVDFFLVLSKSHKKILKKVGVTEAKINITNTMVDSSRFKKQDLLKTNEMRILCCGRIKKAKGIYELLEAIPLIIKKHPNTKFYFMGNESRVPDKVDLGLLAFKKRVESMNLEKYVILTGYVSGNEKLRYYNISDMYVLPSYSEGLPNVFCESMAAGLPFISTSVGGLQDSVENGKNGFLLENLPPEPKEIAEKIVYLLDNPHILQEMSKNSINVAKSRYDVKTVCNEMSSVYRNIINFNSNSINSN